MSVGPAELAIFNARVLTLDPRQPRAEALAVRAGRIVAVGSLPDVRQLCGADTQIVDAEGGLAVPAFHDAHGHLLSYARSLSSLDCRGLRSIADLQAALVNRAATLRAGAWLRAVGYDETVLVESRHPDRHDLDAAVPEKPVRLQHRGLHLDILNTAGLRVAGLLDSAAPELERDPIIGEPSGRLYNAAGLLHDRLPPCDAQDLRRDVRQASERLLAWGVTSFQDASATNGPEEWELFHLLADTGDLGVRVFMMAGAQHWRDLSRCRPPSCTVRPGPVKLMLDEATSDPAAIRLVLAEARAAGQAIALHAVSEAELALAVDALRAVGPAGGPTPDRIEHGAVIPDEMLSDLRDLGVTIVGQPALVYERGDVYRGEYPVELHGWLHRAGSLVRAGIPYAAGSDAPVTEPAPGLGFFVLTQRRTRSDAVLGLNEALGAEQALAALTLWPARAIGAADELGSLRPGKLADVAVFDPGFLEGDRSRQPRQRARFTIMDGRLVWSHSGGAS